MGRKNRKPGESLKISATKEAAARAGGTNSRLASVRWLGVEQAVKQSAGSGATARQKRRSK